jgi:ribonuclease Z
MYGDDESFQMACDKKHMLFSEAAAMAKQANVNELWLTHFSPSLGCPDQYLIYAKAIFSNTVTGHSLMKKNLRFE